MDDAAVPAVKIVPVVPALGVPGTAPVAPVAAPVGAAPAAPEADELRAFAYTAGFLHGAWADTVLSVGALPPLHVHALFVSQSPVLYRHLSAAGPARALPRHVALNPVDPHITAAALSAAVGTLYGHPIELQRCDLPAARALLAAGVLLGLTAVARRGYELLVGTLSLDTLPALFEVALADPADLSGPASPHGPSGPSGPNGVLNGPNGVGPSGPGGAPNGPALPYGVPGADLPASGPPPGFGPASPAPATPGLSREGTPGAVAASANGTPAGTPAPEPAGAYPPFTAPLLGIVTDYFLEHVDTAAPRQPAAVERLFASLPFPIYKRLVEHPQLRAASVQERHRFAQGMTRVRAAAGHAPEQVVLSFGGGSSGVEVVQR